MVNVRDKMAQLSEGVLRITTKDGTDFELKPSYEVKRELLWNYKQTHLNGLKREYHDNDMKLVKQVLEESYPEFDEEQIISIMKEYDSELLQELYIGYGWVDKDTVEALDLKKKIMINQLRNYLSQNEENVLTKLENNFKKNSSEETNKKN